MATFYSWKHCFDAQVGQIIRCAFCGVSYVPEGRLLGGDEPYCTQVLVLPEGDLVDHVRVYLEVGF